MELGNKDNFLHITMNSEQLVSTKAGFKSSNG